jgi:hypothetical protein
MMIDRIYIRAFEHMDEALRFAPLSSSAIQTPTDGNTKAES